MDSSLNEGLFSTSPKIVRHPSEKDPKRSPSLENGLGFRVDDTNPALP